MSKIVPFVSRKLAFLIAAIAALITILAADSRAAGYAAAVQADGPIAYWRFSDNPPTAANSGSLGSAADGTYTGGATAGSQAPAPPQFVGFESSNTALQCNGTDAYVGTANSLINGRPVFTISGWIRRNGPQANRTGLWGQNDIFEFGYIANGTLEVWTDNGLDITGGGIPDGEWAHMAMVSTGSPGTMSLYTNGVLAGSRAHSLPADNTFKFNIGGGGVFDGANNWFDGQIDEVAVFDKALTDVQIAAQYHAAFVPVGYTFADCATPANTSLYGSGGPNGTIADDGTGTNCVVHLSNAGQASAWGVFLINDLASGNNVDRINFKWRSRIGGGDAGGADGYSLNWATDLPAPPTYGNPGEEGAGTGLSFNVDTWDNGGEDHPGIQIKYKGAVVAFLGLGKDAGVPTYLRKNTFVNAEAGVDGGVATFTYDGATISAVLDNWQGITGGGYMFGARTGGANDNQWIDDIYVTTYPPSLPFVKRQPIDQTVKEGLGAFFSVETSGSGPLAYQWQIKRTADADFSDIAGETTSSFTIGRVAYPADNGALVKVKVSNSLGATESAAAMLTVLDDAIAPTILSAAGNATFNQVSLLFSETMDNRSTADGGTVNDNFNYTLKDAANNSIGINSAVLSPDGMGVVLTTDPYLENTVYTVTAVNTEDRAGNPIVAGNNTATFRSYVNSGPCNGVLFERYTGLSGPNVITTLTGNPKYPNSPDIVTTLPSFAAGVGAGDNFGDNYGGRLRGLFIPDATASYVFYLSADDSSQLWINPNGASAAGKVLVQQDTGCCGDYSAHATAPIPMVAGQGYFIEAIYQEGGGGDYCFVAVRKQGEPAPAGRSELDAIPGSNLGIPSAPANVGGVLSIATSPASVTVRESASATFTVVYNNPNGLPVCAQWYRDGVAILGANGLSYTIPIVAISDDGAKFSVQGSIIGSSAPLSAEATLTVTKDTTPPVCVSAAATHVFSEVIVNFDELLSLGNSPVDRFGYSMAGFDTTAVRLNSDGKSVTVTFSPKLTLGASYTIVVRDVEDLAGNALGTCSLNFTMSQGSGLFIEAEDFNYSNDDGTSPGQHAEFGDPDCSLFGKNAVNDVDYHENNNGNDQAIYRGPTGVEAGKLNEANESVRGDYTVSCNYIVGWNDPGDWRNYTRDFGPSKRYNVYARLSSGGADEHGELAVITSDPTQPNQTLKKVGNFDSPATGNWDVFHTIPMKDAAGNLASLRLSGLMTLRYTTGPGNQDVNYLSFVEAAVQVVLPTIGTVNPPNNSDSARAPKIIAGVTDQDSKVNASSLKLIFDGQDVTALSTITDTADGATIAFQAPGGSAAGTTHNVQVQWQDDQATPVGGSYAWSYKEGIYNAERNLFIEMEDYNTGGGQYVVSTAGHPFNEKGQYKGLSAVQGTDYNDHTTDANGNYRAGDVTSGMASLDDANRGGAGPRPGFELTSDFKIGWTDGGDWFNYTRDYGAGGGYYVFLRASHGDGAATIGGGLARVDNGSNSPTRLGSFRAPSTGGWDTFTFIPLKDEAGNNVVVPLSGVATLQYTVEANGGDINYLMLCPVVPASACPVASGSQVRLDQDSSTPIQLAATDANGDRLLYTITQAPAHGVLVIGAQTGAGTYTPTRGYCGPDSFKFKVTDGQCTSEEATVNIDVHCLNLPPIAVINSEQLINLKPEYENPVLLSCNWWNACLVADGWTSSDPEGGNLTYLWFEENDATPFAGGPVVTNCVEVGTHIITLVVTDVGGLTGSDTKTFEVVTAPLAIDLLIEQVDTSHKSGILLTRKTKRELIATLRLALGFAGREQLRETQRALDAFEKKVRAQVTPTYPAAATAWIRWSQAVSQGMEKCIKPPRKPKHDEDPKNPDPKTPRK